MYSRSLSILCANSFFFQYSWKIRQPNTITMKMRSVFTKNKMFAITKQCACVYQWLRHRVFSALIEISYICTLNAHIIWIDGSKKRWIKCPNDIWLMKYIQKLRRPKSWNAATNVEWFCFLPTLCQLRNNKNDDSSFCREHPLRHCWW